MSAAASASTASLVTVTDRACQEIRSIFKSDPKEGDVGLRLAVTGGGCSGLSYAMDFCERREDDTILEFEGFSVLLDPKSTIYLKGITLDFNDGLMGKGFVFSNPNATNTCGCGESFSV